jgi:hypothetical protein
LSERMAFLFCWRIGALSICWVGCPFFEVCWVDFVFFSTNYLCDKTKII